MWSLPPPAVAPSLPCEEPGRGPSAATASPSIESGRGPSRPETLAADPSPLLTKTDSVSSLESEGSSLLSLEGSDCIFEDLEDRPNPRYKTEMCRNFKERAKCLYGDQCQFAHGKRELRDVVRNTKYKTKHCQKYWVTGYCAYGPRCNFLHNEPESHDDPPPGGGRSRFRKFSFPGPDRAWLRVPNSLAATSSSVSLDPTTPDLEPDIFSTMGRWTTAMSEAFQKTLTDDR